VTVESLVLEDCSLEPGAGTGVHLGVGEHRLTNVSILGGVFGLVLDSTATVMMERVHVSGVSGTALDLSGAAVLESSLIVDNPDPATGILVRSSGNLQMRYATVAGNGTGLMVLSPNVQVDHSILCGNTTDLSGVPCSAIDFSDVCGTNCTGLGNLDCTGAEGNLSIDPLFTNPASGDYRVPSFSPVVDAGVAAECFTGSPCHDFENKPRLLDADGDGSARSDMGAYELDYPAGLIPEPDDVQNLTISLEGGPVHALNWDPEPSASSYHIYEGLISNLGADYNLNCLATVAGPPFVLPSIEPAPGEVLVYAVSGDDTTEEGTLGYGTCMERSNLVDPCP